MREIRIGTSNRYLAWTDGSSYVAFAREYLASHHLVKQDRPDLASLLSIAITLAHELVHDSDDLEDVAHPPEFDKEFRNKLESSQWGSQFPYAVQSVVNSLTPKRLVLLKKGVKPNADPEEGNIALITAIPTPQPEVVELIAAKETPKPPKEAKTGRTAKDILKTAKPEELVAIFAAYRGNGGPLSYEGIEKDSRFNLRLANGCTAYRIIKRLKHSQILGTPNPEKR
jgi:hypothetical protein